MGHCRVLWLGIAHGREECCKLKGLIDDSLVSLGFPKEAQEFIPHVTLTRSKLPQRVSAETYNEHFRAVLSTHMTASELTLMKSELKPTGPIYTKLAAFDFKNV